MKHPLTQSSSSKWFTNPDFVQHRQLDPRKKSLLHTVLYSSADGSGQRLVSNPKKKKCDAFYKICGFLRRLKGK